MGVPGEMLVIASSQTRSQSCDRRHPSLLYSAMKDLLMIVAHLLTTLAKLLAPGGAKAIIADSLVMKQQLLIVNRFRQRAPNLTATDRMLLGFWSLL